MRLTDTDLLKELAKPEHAAVRAAFVSRRYARGSQVFLPREARNCLFIVAKGRARVYLANRDKEFTMKHIIGTGDKPVEGKFKVNILGEYNIGGDAFEIERILDKCGFTLIATFSGNSTVESFREAHYADLNTVMIGQMSKDSMVIDDISHYETEKLIEMLKPDIFCAGIKEKYIIQKMGVPLKQLHNYDMSGFRRARALWLPEASMPPHLRPIPGTGT